MSGTVYTERGQVKLDTRENRLYGILASDRTRVWSLADLVKAMDCTPRQVDVSAATLRSKFKAIGLTLVVNVWGVGYRLESIGR